MRMPVIIERDDEIKFEVINSGLSQTQFDSLFNPAINKYTIKFSGNFKHLDFLMQQVSCAKEKEIIIEIKNVEVDNNISLPFNILGANTILLFGDQPELQSNFYTYLLNIWEPVYNSSILHIPEMHRERITKERKIQADFLNEFENILNQRGKELSDYSKSQLMDVIFKYVVSNFPYDTSILEPDGNLIPEFFELGITAQMTFERGKGVCSGRSKLIKLLANNRMFQIPCYLVRGKHGNLEHMWNEYIDEQGNIIEYDSSFKMKCMINELPKIYIIKSHEPDVEKVLKKIR